MDAYYTLAGIFGFLVASGIIYIIVGALATLLLGRFAVIPTLKKIDKIIDIIIEKCEDGDCTPSDAEAIMKVIKEEIGSDAAYKFVAWLQKVIGGSPKEQTIKK